MDIIKSIVVALTSPLTLALLFLTIGWILAFTRARKTSRFFRFSAFIWLALCSQTFLPISCYTPWSIRSEPLAKTSLLIRIAMAMSNKTQLAQTTFMFWLATTTPRVI